jgi:SAM-dependent methyltransferase
VSAAAGLDRATRRAIAGAFLPSRWHYHYAASKLASDPLYGGVVGALRGTRAPLLDLGCGIGLLAHVLAAAEPGLAYTGVDNDAGKIAQAQAAAARAGLARAGFACVDLARAFPDHRGSVAVLDVLQFLPAVAQSPLLARAAACLTPDARLVIRTGLADGNWRSRVTRGVDRLSRALRWMNAGPDRYPSRDGLAAELAGLGLDSVFAPLWGRTPFNNWLVVASPSSGSTAR